VGYAGHPPGALVALRRFRMTREEFVPEQVPRPVFKFVKSQSGTGLCAVRNEGPERGYWHAGPCKRPCRSANVAKIAALHRSRLIPEPRPMAPALRPPLCRRQSEVVPKIARKAYPRRSEPLQGLSWVAAPAAGSSSAFCSANRGEPRLNHLHDAVPNPHLVPSNRLARISRTRDRSSQIAPRD